MKNEIEIFELIGAYLRKEMTNEERLKFEKKLSSDDYWAKKLLQYQEEEKVIELMIKEDLKSKIQEWDKEKISNKPNSVKSTRRNLFFFFMILLLMTLGIFYWAHSKNTEIPKAKNNSKSIEKISPLESEEEINKNQIIIQDTLENKKSIPNEKIKKPSKQPIVTTTKETTNNKQKLTTLLAMSYDQITFGDYQERSNQNNDEQSLNEALLHFKQNQYKSGCKILTELLLKDPTNLDLQYYLAAGFYNQKEFKKTISNLDNLMLEPNYLYIEQVEWILTSSLAYSGQMKKSIVILKRISSDPEHAYHEKAVNLLENL